MNAVLNESSPETTGAMIAELVQIRDRKRLLEAEMKELNEQWDAIKVKLMAKMESEGSNRVSSGDGSVGITETIVPQVDDWDAFNAYLLETGDLHLLQRRPATAAYRELVEAGKEVPGVRPFVKKDISLRST